MAAELFVSVDVNTAEQNELTQLPGVGGALAERIIAARPYAEPEDLLAVAGVGPALLERLRPHLAFPDVADEVVVEPDDELDMAAEAVPIPDLDFDDIPQPDPGPDEKAPARPIPGLSLTAVPKPAPSNAGRGQMLWIAFGSGLLSFLLAVAVVLGVLAGINKGLRYVSPAEFADLNRQVDGLSTEVDTLQMDLEDLRTRLDTLEALSGRVNTLESSVSDMQTDLAETTTQMEDVQTQVDGLAADVAEVRAAAGRFDTFLQGLADLLLKTTDTPGGTDGE